MFSSASPRAQLVGSQDQVPEIHFRRPPYQDGVQHVARHPMHAASARRLHKRHQGARPALLLKVVEVLESGGLEIQPRRLGAGGSDTLSLECSNIACRHADLLQLGHDVTLPR
eukprot:TRINITY_DN11618_c0_g3_i3.p5 TRINITY_DN11618_c0_g3~~TRINITY_DN11618_c0_g3_i3.p5  ORF type:complete len:113 (-),score=7.42 TRINITY_DN11618_c0_g3_i3:1305-1643(-)